MTDIQPYTIYAPQKPVTYLILAVPHAGVYAPPEFLKEARLSLKDLRLSEDSFTDELFWNDKLGIPMIKANYARFYLDVNREPYELNQKMFKDKLPEYVNHFSKRAAAGFGTLPQVVKKGMKIYKGKITFAEAKERIDEVYRPYHNALAKMIKKTDGAFGQAFVIDCHSMPTEKARNPVDIVLGNNFGTAADKFTVDMVTAMLESMGYKVGLNHPYAGGYTTSHYGCPELGVRALQIEIRRSLYMNESTLEKTSDFNELQNNLKALMKLLKAAMK